MKNIVGLDNNNLLSSDYVVDETTHQKQSDITKNQEELIANLKQQVSELSSAVSSLTSQMNLIPLAGQGRYGDLSLAPQSGDIEGGQINLYGAGNNHVVCIDNYNGMFRAFFNNTVYTFGIDGIYMGGRKITN